jgi:hypothetical protein
MPPLLRLSKRGHQVFIGAGARVVNPDVRYAASCTLLLTPTFITRHFILIIKHETFAKKYNIEIPVILFD